MEILVNRRKKTKTTTISDVLIDGVFYCFGLEDTDRGLTQKMPLEEIKQKKYLHKQPFLQVGMS